MSNINRDYLIILDVKTGEVDSPNIYYFNTDKNTSNLYVQMVLSETTVEANPIENATNYSIKANILKPNMVGKIVEGNLVNEEKAIYEFKLPADCTDFSGNAKIEFEVYCAVDGVEKIVTSFSTKFKVHGSVLTEQNKYIEDSSDYPILKKLIEDIKDMQNSGQISHVHDNKTILDSITSTKVNNWDKAYTHSQSLHFSGNYNDLTNKPAIPTKTSQLTNDSGYITNIPGEYITEAELNAKGYATTSQIPTVPTNVSEFTNDANYASETFVTNKIAEATLSGGTSIDDTTTSTNKTWSSDKINSQIKDLVIDSGNIMFRDVMRGEIFTVETSSESPDIPPTENVDITGITLNNHTLSIENGETKTLIATVSPSNATNKNVIWNVTNSNATIVTNGLQCSITGVSTGSCQVTVTTEQGSFTDSCDIAITEVVATDYIKDNLIVDLDMTNIGAEDAVITDKSGTGNNFTIVTPVASSAEGYWHPGKLNGAYCTNLITLGTDDFTLEIYCSMNNLHNQPYITLGTSTWSSTQTNLSLTPYGNVPVPPLVLTLGLGKDNYYPQFDLSSYVSLDSFAYITIVKQSNNFTCYIDGELATTFTSEKALNFISSPLSINCIVDDNLGTGISRYNAYSKFKLLRLYKGKSLTADEVSANYNVSKTIGGN